MNEDLKRIKKKYGEKMSHFCRENFSHILDTLGLLPELLESHFEPSHELYQDILENTSGFITYISAFLEEKPQVVTTNKTPKELMNEVGYILYECHTEEEIQAFKKYYAPGEELCTFKGGRLEDCYVFFAIKKNVSAIKRENFKEPKRQDEYGTSVISIQFSKQKPNHLSIKNRYNDIVTNPDSTFSNNLENIAPGLTSAFSKIYNLDLTISKNNFEMANYVKVKEKYYKYNKEMNNIFYSPQNMIIDNGKVIRLAKEKYLLMDYFILDIEKKELKLYDEKIKDSFVDHFQNMEKITILKEKKQKKVLIKTVENQTPIEITLNKANQIEKLDMAQIKKIGNNFCKYNFNIHSFKASNAKRIGYNFFYANDALEKIDIDSVEEIGDNFCYTNNKIKIFAAPKVKKIGYNFFTQNESLEKIYLPNAEEIKNDFCYYNKIITTVDIQKLRILGDNFCFQNEKLQEINLENVEKIGHNFLNCNKKILIIRAPKVKEIGCNFLLRNSVIKIITIENAEEIGNNFCTNANLKIFCAPKIKKESQGHFFQTAIFQKRFALINQKELLKILKENANKITL